MHKAFEVALSQHPLVLPQARLAVLGTVSPNLSVPLPLGFAYLKVLLMTFLGSQMS